MLRRERDVYLSITPDIFNVLLFWAMVRESIVINVFNFGKSVGKD
jgi:hypothetical protein